MQEVIQKISDLVKLLEEKNNATEVLNKQLSLGKAEIEETHRKQKATANQLAARERIVTKAEDFAKEKQAVKDQVKRTQAQKNKNNKDAANNLKSKSELEEKQIQLDNMVEVFKKKNEKLDALEIQLKTERKLMREKILKEIQGKL